MNTAYICAAIIVIIVVIAAVVYKKRNAVPNSHENYLIAPYLDLTSPGERGQYYAMSR
jgi:hypothetical protein